MTDIADDHRSIREPQDGLDDFRALVRSAFEKALVSGKPGWQEMTSAVLKNRLLDLTSREFSEARYGSQSFLGLVRRIPDLIEVVGGQPPYALRIQPSAVEQLGAREPTAGANRSEDAQASGVLLPTDWKRVRIRDDLWKATIDYNSGSVYIFDPSEGLARPREVTDPDLPELPTATPDEVASWRAEFLDQVLTGLDASSRQDLEVWVDTAGRLKDLPRPARGLWAQFVKKKVTAKLHNWFQGHDQAPPDDMLVDAQTKDYRPSHGIDDVVHTRQLRDMLIRAIRSMTYDELSRISLPAQVVLRLTRKEVQAND